MSAAKRFAFISLVTLMCLPSVARSAPLPVRWIPWVGEYLIDREGVAIIQGTLLEGRAGFVGQVLWTPPERLMVERLAGGHVVEARPLEGALDNWVELEFLEDGRSVRVRRKAVTGDGRDYRIVVREGAELLGTGLRQLELTGKQWEALSKTDRALNTLREMPSTVRELLRYGELVEARSHWLSGRAAGRIEAFEMPGNPVLAEFQSNHFGKTFNRPHWVDRARILTGRQLSPTERGAIEWALGIRDPVAHVEQGEAFLYAGWRPFSFLQGAALLSPAADAKANELGIEIFSGGQIPLRVQDAAALSRSIMGRRVVLVRNELLKSDSVLAALRESRSTVWALSDRSICNPAMLGTPTAKFKVGVIAPVNEAEARTLFGTKNVEGWDAFQSLVKAGKVTGLRSRGDVARFVNEAEKAGQRPVLFFHSKEGLVPLVEGEPYKTAELLGRGRFALTCLSAPQAPEVGDTLLTVRDLRWRDMSEVAKAVADAPQAGPLDLAGMVETVYAAAGERRIARVEVSLRIVVGSTIAGAAGYLTFRELTDERPPTTSKAGRTNVTKPN